MMQGNNGTDISELGNELARLRRRAARQKRNISRNSDDWQRWSSTVDEIAALTERLVASPAANIDSLAVKFRAILWLIEVNDSLLDHGDLRRLRRFNRDLAGHTLLQSPVSNNRSATDLIRAQAKWGDAEKGHTEVSVDGHRKSPLHRRASNRQP
jgi:hypothetical protein